MNTSFANSSSLTGIAGSGQATETKGHGVAQRVATWFASLADLPRRRREAAELSQFSDRELSDIGLTRGDLDRIQSPEFAADYHAGRNSAMFLIRA